MIDLGILAAMLAGQFDLRVRVENIPTFAVGKDEKGPVLFVSASLSGIEDVRVDEVSTMLRGALAHECVGHLPFTDMDAPRPAGLLGSIANVLEDLRIESLAPSAYPGARRILADMVAELESDRHRFWSPDKAKGPENAILLYVLRQCRAEQLGQPLRPAWTQTFRDRAVEAYGEGTVRQALDMARQAIAQPDTPSIITLAQQLLDLLKQSVQQPQQQPQPQPPSSGDDDQGDQGEQSSGDDQGSDQSESPASSGDDGGAPDEESPESCAGAKQGSARSIDENLEINASPEDYIKDAMGNILKRGAVRQEKDYSGQEVISGPIQTPAVAHRLRGSLQRALASLRDDEEDAMTDHGRLHLGALIDAVATKRSHAQIFIEDGAVGEGIDTALYLMVDQSGSMDKIKDFALMTVQAIGEACGQFEGQGLEFMAGYFDDYLRHIKNASQSWASSRGRATARYLPGSGTCWPESATAALRRLVQSKRRRKVLLTITDGDLGNARDTAINSAKMAGIELAFVGIDAQAIPGLAFESANSDQPNSIVQATQRALLSALRPIVA
jgi:hypothetical protein